MALWNDYNDVKTNPNLIPKGTLAKVRLTIRPGGFDDASQGWTGGYATRGTTGAVYLSAEFTVLEGQYAKRKIWSLIGLYSPKGPDWANIGRSLIRGMLNSARGLSDRDVSPQAQTARRINGFADLDGIEFVARIDVGSDTNGDEKNEVRGAVTRDHRDYAQFMGQGAAPMGYAAAPAYAPPPVSPAYAPGVAPQPGFAAPAAPPGAFPAAAPVTGAPAAEPRRAEPGRGGAACAASGSEFSAQVMGVGNPDEDGVPMLQGAGGAPKNTVGVRANVVVSHRLQFGDVAPEDLHLLHELGQAGLLVLLAAGAAHRSVSCLAGRRPLRVMDHSRCGPTEPSSKQAHIITNFDEPGSSHGNGPQAEADPPQAGDRQPRPAPAAGRRGAGGARVAVAATASE